VDVAHHWRAINHPNLVGARISWIHLYGSRGGDRSNPASRIR